MRPAKSGALCPTVPQSALMKVMDDLRRMAQDQKVQGGTD